MMFTVQLEKKIIAEKLKSYNIVQDKARKHTYNMLLSYKFSSLLNWVNKE